MKKISFNQRRFKYGTLATVITVVFIAIVVLANVVISMLIDRFQWKVDLTPNKTFGITDKTKDYLKTLDKDITITVLTDESNLSNSNVTGKQVSEVISKYSQYSKKIKVEYVDPDKNPQIIANINQTYKGTLSDKFVLVQNGDRIKALTQDDLVTSSQDSSGAYTTSSTAEQAMTSAIMNVTDANPKKATLLIGETASDATPLTDLLDKNGYTVDQVDILTGVIDQTSDIVIVNSPLNDYNQDEISKLDKYLYNDGKLGKNIVYIASYQQKLTPNIDAFIAEYGLQIGTGYVVDSNTQNMTSLGNNMYGLYTSISNSNYSADISQSKLPLVVPYSRPINLLFETKDTRTTESLLSTADTAFVVPIDATANTDFTKLPHSVINTMAVGSKYVFDSNNNKVTSNIVAVGSDIMLESMLLSSAQLNNGDYMLSIINKLTGKATGMTIVPKDLTSAKLTMTQAQANSVFYVVVIVIPLLIIIAGIVVWVRRRNR